MFPLKIRLPIPLEPPCISDLPLQAFLVYKSSSFTLEPPLYHHSTPSTSEPPFTPESQLYIRVGNSTVLPTESSVLRHNLHHSGNMAQGKRWSSSEWGEEGGSGPLLNAGVALDVVTLDDLTLVQGLAFLLCGQVHFQHYSSK